MTVIYENDIATVRHGVDNQYHITYPEYALDRPLFVTSDRDEAIRSAKDRLLYRYIMLQMEKTQ